MKHNRPFLATVLMLTALPAAILAEEASISPTVRFLSTIGMPRAHSGRHSVVAGTGTEYIPMIVRLDSDSATLPDYVNELHRRGEIALVMVPEERVSEFAGTRGVRRLETHVASLPSLSSARQFCNLPEATAAPSTGSALDGTGVVVGFADSGFDPNHLNFFDGKGQNRIRKLVDYNILSPAPDILSTEEKIARWDTDNPSEYHATHVAGILAGSYTGDNMQGVATGADIVATTSPLYDALLLDGCEEIISYAREHNKPAVINLSISSMTGPHDGTTLFNRYMESITDDATVCISAGNEAQRTGYVCATTTESTPAVRTYFRQYPSLSPLSLTGTVDIWSDNDAPLKVTILKQDFHTFEITRIPVTLDPDNGIHEWMICSHEYAQIADSIPYTEMPDNFFGYIHVAAEVNPENNRYNVALQCAYEDFTTTVPDDASLLFGVEVEPEASGTHIEFYSTSGIYFTRHGDRDKTSPIPDGTRTINDFCAGEGPICIGSFDTRTSSTNLLGEVTGYPKLSIGGVSYFSSYATLDNGTVLPHICAPGAQIISSISEAYCNEHPAYPEQTAAIKRTANGRTHYWGPEQGTSMSSPFAAGVAALWLQANPDLTGKQIRDIMVSTASSPTSDPSNPQWGRGILDAKAGLEMARSLVGIAPVADTGAKDNIGVRVSQGCLTISHPTRRLSCVTVISPDGAVVHTSTPCSYDTTIDSNAFPAGIYIVSAVDEGGLTHSAKVAFR